MACALEESHTKMPLMEVQEFSNTLYALARLRCRPSDEWLAHWVACSQKRLPEFEPQNLSNAIFAFAAMGYRPPAAWCAVHLREVQANMMLLTPVQLCDTIWALADLGISVDRKLMSRFMVHSTGKLTSMSSSELATFASTLVLLKQRPSDEWLRVLALEAVNQAQLFEPAPLCHLLAAFGALRFMPDGSWMEAFLNQAKSRVAAFRGGEVAQLLHALVALNYRPGDEWLSCFCQHLARRINDCTGSEVLTAIQALAQLQFKSEQELMAQLMGSTQQDRVQPQPPTAGTPVNSSSNQQSSAPTKSILLGTHGPSVSGARHAASWAAGRLAKPVRQAR